MRSSISLICFSLLLILIENFKKKKPKKFLVLHVLLNLSLWRVYRILFCGAEALEVWPLSVTEQNIHGSK